MGTYRLVVFSNPVAGREKEYNNWYNDKHLGDVVAIPGIVAAQRFKLHSKVTDPEGKAPHEYLAIYEIETNDLDKTLRELQTRPGTVAMPMSEAIDGAGATGTIFEVITPRMLAK